MSDIVVANHSNWRMITLKGVVLSFASVFFTSSLFAADAKLAFQVSSEANYYEFDTGVIRGKMRWDGRAQGICELVHSKSGVQIVQKGLSLVCPYRIFSSDMRYGDAARDWPTESKVLSDGALEVFWPATEEHPLEITAVYRWRSADALDVETTVKPRIDLPRFEVFMASYFTERFEAFVYVKPNMFAKGPSILMPADFNPMVDGTYLMFPRNREAALMIFGRRWEFPPSPVQWSITRMYAGPLAVRKDEQSGVAVLLMSPPEDCFAVSMSYNKTPPDRVAGHSSLYLSLFGRDLKSGEPQKARLRMVVGKDLADAQMIERYQQYQKE